MLRRLFALCLFVAGALDVTPSARADGGEHRFAFVVGNGGYADSPLPTAANDAGLIAQTLQAAGFDVVGARDLDADTFRQSYADFLQRVGGAGPDTVAFVYLAGYGVQYGPDTYYVPIGAHVSRPADIPFQAIRFSDLLSPLEGLNIKARFFVADAAYRAPFAGSRDVPGGLGLIDPAPGSLIAYSAAPGMVVAPATKDYGLYAQLLAAEMRVGGLAPDELFERLRLRVSTASEGREIPWDASKLDKPFVFFERGADAPALPRPRVLADRVVLRDLPVGEAYTAAVARDDIAAYTEFLAVYGNDPLAKRIRILLAARREARTWDLTRKSDEPSAYWTYLQRYPKGPHAAAARARLARLGADEAPPPRFVPLVWDVPPPEPFERDIVDAGPIDLDGRGYELGPAPLPDGDDRLAPLPPELLKLRPPPEPEDTYALPVPVFVPLPIYINPPRNIARPRNNRFFTGGGDPHRAFPRGDNGEEINVIVIPRPEPARRRGEDLDRAPGSGRSEVNSRRTEPLTPPDVTPTVPQEGPVAPLGAGGGAPLPPAVMDLEHRRNDRFDNGHPGAGNGATGAPRVLNGANGAPRLLDKSGQGDRGTQDGVPNGWQNGSQNERREGQREERRKERREERRQERLNGVDPQPLPVPNGATVNPGRVERRDVRPGGMTPRPGAIQPVPHVPPSVVPYVQPGPQALPHAQTVPRMERREMERPRMMGVPRVERHEMMRQVPNAVMRQVSNAVRQGGNRFDQRP